MMIVHFTDLHVLKNPPSGETAIRDNVERLQRTIDAICQLRPRPDVALITGDLSHDGDVRDYEFCRSILARLPCPYFMVPGNHDNRAIMRAVFPIECERFDSRFYQFECDAFPLRIVGIDTLTEGEVGGGLCTHRLEWIGQTLMRSRKPTLLMMHHPPFQPGIVENSKMSCSVGRAALTDVVSRNGQVVAILSGHLHSHMNVVWAGAVASSAPSVAPAFFVGRHSKERARLVQFLPGIFRSYLDGRGRNENAGTSSR